jgi:hypothetical protein
MMARCVEHAGVIITNGDTFNLKLLAVVVSNIMSITSGAASSSDKYRYLTEIQSVP